MQLVYHVCEISFLTSIESIEHLRLIPWLLNVFLLPTELMLFFPYL